ncbi:MAG: hypothetical protein GVY19_11940 [Bacteroidetes bacterium]|jgi:hypothetical protein|nr:hypothetical protein [Bacteroidota bacterium]
MRHIIALIALTFAFTQIEAQAWKKLKEKIEDEVVESVLPGSDTKNNQSNETYNNQSSPSSADRPAQKSGMGGLDHTAKDVTASLDAASGAFSSKNYKSARTSLREAIYTVDMEIGQRILNHLPSQVEGLSAQESNDQIEAYSSSWSGLSVKREYQQGDQWVGITVFNSSFAGMANTAIQSGMYNSYNKQDENQKSVQVNQNQAVISFSESSGYQVNVSLGQETFVLVEGVNIVSEAGMMEIAESFDYNFIKDILGEQ